LRSRALNRLLKVMRRITRLWQSASMQFKVKAFLGLFQCVAAIPSVYDVVPPVGLEEYIRWIYMIELPAELTSLVISPQCIGSYHRCVAH
jgi:hypothetical protein